MKLCSHCDKYPVFSKGLCRFHQYLRVDRPKTPFRALSLKSGSKIPSESKRRSEERVSYKQVCDEIDREAISEKRFDCFFCGGAIQGKADHHHLLGREGENYTNKELLVLAHNRCHVYQYHTCSVSQLVATGWYGGFLVRLREKSDKAFAKEMKKIEKYLEM